MLLPARPPPPPPACRQKAELGGGQILLMAVFTADIPRLKAEGALEFH